MAKNVQLGQEYHDRISGFIGVATSRTEYLYGCVRVGLESRKAGADGKPLDTQYFDEQRLVTQSSARAGGPGNVPPRRDPPKR